MTWRRRGPLALIILIGIFLLVAPGAWAARVDCGVLLKGAADAGVTPTLYLDPDYGVARLESGGDYCLEPIEVWKARGLALKSSGKPPGAGAAESPAQAPASAAPPGAARETAPLPPPPPRPRQMAEPCDMDIGEFWHGTVIAVGDVSYRLVRVYTIDLDSDNRVDDVGFRLKARRQPDLVISYLRGDLPGGTIPELQLSDEGVIERLCFGNLVFEMPRASTQTIPDLAAETKSRMEFKTSPKESVAAKEAPAADDEIPLWMWLVLGLAVFMMVGAGAAWFFLIRGQADDEDEEAGDEDDEDDW